MPRVTKLKIAPKNENTNLTTPVPMFQRLTNIGIVPRRVKACASEMTPQCALVIQRRAPGRAFLFFAPPAASRLSIFSQKEALSSFIFIFVKILSGFGVKPQFCKQLQTPSVLTDAPAACAPRPARASFLNRCECRRPYPRASQNPSGFSDHVGWTKIRFRSAPRECRPP